MSVRIDVDAVKALVHWKALFVDEISKQAKQIAIEDGSPNRISVEHYKQAADFAIQKLSVEILREDSDDDREQAA